MPQLGGEHVGRDVGRRRRRAVPSRSATSPPGPRSAPSQWPPGTQPCRGDRRSATSPDRPDGARRAEDRVVLVDPQRAVGLAGEGAGRATRSSGRAPTAASTTSASISLPSASRTPLAPTSTTCAPVSSRTPAAAYQGAVSPPDDRPERRAERAARASTTATSTPAAAATPATSAPIQPAPITTSRVPGRSARAERARRPRRCAASARPPSPAGGRRARRWRGRPRRPTAAPSSVGTSTAARPYSDEPARRGAQAHLVGEGGQVDADLVGEPGRRGAVEQVLGQRRPVVRGEALGAEHHDPPVEPPLTQRGDRLGGREPAPTTSTSRGSGGVAGGRRRSGRSPRNGSLPSGGTSEMVKERMSGGAGVRRAAPARPGRRCAGARRAARADRPADPPSTGPIPVEERRSTRAPSRARRSPPARNASLWWTSAGIVVATSWPLVVGTRAGAFVLAASCSACAVVRAVLPSPGPVALSVRARRSTSPCSSCSGAASRSCPDPARADPAAGRTDARDHEGPGRRSCGSVGSALVTTRTSSVVTYASSSSSRLSSTGSAANAR